MAFQGRPHVQPMKSFKLRDRRLLHQIVRRTKKHFVPYYPAPGDYHGRQSTPRSDE